MCGIFGVCGHEEASNLTYLGLYALQHRGQESAGIVSTDGDRLFRLRRRALVSESFDRGAIGFLKGSMAVGHVRYSTTGERVDQNKQPYVASGGFGELAVAHNGNLTNFSSLRREAEERGAVFHSSMDTEVLLHRIAVTEGGRLEDRIARGLQGVEGAYSLLVLARDRVIAVRDPFGFRPLVLGVVDGSYVVSSETCAFDLINARLEREIEPGEMVVLRPGGGIETIRFAKPQTLSQCVFEHIYFARPDSILFGRSVYEVRERLGRELYREHQSRVSADIVVPVPDSGTIAAMGFSQESGIPLRLGLIRNHYVGRTFIEPRQSIRSFGVKIKLNPVSCVLRGKRVAVLDDSIVRGTTSRKIVKMLRDAGAAEVHAFISSPPVTGPCYYGIDTPTSEELIGSRKSVEETRLYIGADTLNYLSLAGVYRAVGNSRSSYCDACFSNRYPTPLKLDHNAVDGVV